MKFRINSTSCWYNNISDQQESKLKEYKINREDDFLYIEINTLEELVQLSKTLEEPVILFTNNKDLVLEIYDDWRE